MMVYTFTKGREASEWASESEDSLVYREFQNSTAKQRDHVSKNEMMERRKEGSKEREEERGFEVHLRLHRFFGWQS